jgi:hypothetical protein
MGEKPTEVRPRTLQDRLTDALAEGDIQPSHLLELLYYGSEPDLVAVMRAIAALDSPTRLKVLSIAQAMSRPMPGAAQAGRKFDA